MPLNKIMLIGRLGKDLELKTTQSGKSVVNFSIATSEKFTDSDGTRQEKTEWHNCVAWQKTAETMAQYLKKGVEVYVEGKVTYGKYTNKEGQEVPKTEIVVHSFTFIGNKKDDSDGAGTANTAAAGPTGGGDDDLPF